MAAFISLSKRSDNMHTLINKISETYPDLQFSAGDKFYWSPGTNQVVYDNSRNDTAAKWALLHEASHAILAHKNYRNDFQLITLEMEAWEQAKQLASDFSVETINDDHIQDCLDTYRDWLHKRCVCPHCGSRSLQSDSTTYRCHNCLSCWKVTASRFCRAYRLSTDSRKQIA